MRSHLLWMVLVKICSFNGFFLFMVFSLHKFKRLEFDNLFKGKSINYSTNDLLVKYIECRAS